MSIYYKYPGLSPDFGFPCKIIPPPEYTESIYGVYMHESYVLGAINA